tara:strand:- start:92 stop:346 length:255 start_codon:yes stop_codon:yes gene_type:complete
MQVATQHVCMVFVILKTEKYVMLVCGMNPTTVLAAAAKIAAVLLNAQITLVIQGINDGATTEHGVMLITVRIATQRILHVEQPA